VGGVGYSFYINGILLFQLVCAELLFMSAYPRRKLFILRFIAFFAVWVAAIALYSTYIDGYVKAAFAFFLPSVAAEVISGFLREFLKILLSFCGMGLCFIGKRRSIIAFCSGGYLIQHFCYKLQRIVTAFVNVSSFGLNMYVQDVVITVSFYLIPYVVFYIGFGYSAKKYSYKDRGDRTLDLFSIAMTALMLLINRIESAANITDPTTRLAVGLYGMAFIIAILNIQFFMYRHIKLKADNEVSKMLIQESGKQYEQWKDNLKEINLKYHDLRHELDDIKQAGITSYSEKTEELLNEYGSFIHTGNEMLDVLFTNKRMQCNREGIEFTCFIDKDAVSFFDDMEFYTLFLNALDNAIEAVRKVAEGKRAISMTIKKRGNIVTVQVANYFCGDVVMENELPVSQNEGGVHGYGMTSMCLICERHNGTMGVKIKEDMFYLSLMFRAEK